MSRRRFYGQFEPRGRMFQSQMDDPPASAESLSAGRVSPLAVTAVVLTVFHWAYMATGSRLFTSFWQPQIRHAGSVPILLGLAAMWTGGTLWVCRSRRSWAVRVGALVVMCYLFQIGLALTAGRGLAEIRDRMVYAGHAAFAEAAVQQRDDLLDVARAYEDKIRSRELGGFMQSKPPGALLVYMATERLANAFTGDTSAAARLERMRDFATIVWPFFAALALVPLFALSRRLVGEAAALIACLLLCTAPSYNLMYLHLDQNLFPLGSLFFVWCLVRAIETQRVRWALASACVFYLLCYTSFGMLAVLPLGVTAALAAALISKPERSLVQAVVALARPSAVFAASLVALDVVWRVVFSYDIFAALQRVNAHRDAWVGWHGTSADFVHAAFVTSTEFALAMAVPLTTLTIGGINRAASQIVMWRPRATDVVALGLGFTLLMLVCFSKGRSGESARLWLFLVPFCCIVAAAELKNRLGRFTAPAVLLVLSLQVLTTCLTKIYYDYR